MHDELEHFVASLAIPADRKAIVLAELSDHVACARERDPEIAIGDALGNLEALRRSLEAIESAFKITRWAAIGRGLVAALLIAVGIDQVPVMRGPLGALIVIAIAIVLAPPRGLELLRAELRAPRVRGVLGRGVPIGPALAYLYTVVAAPALVWLPLIVKRAFAGVFHFDTPPSCFAVMFAAYALLLVEGIRARRAAA
jgi:hypothetical protein